MTSQQRVLAAFGFAAVDRLPINYAANPAIDQNLKGHFGLSGNDDEGLRRALGVDFRGIGAGYRGPNRFGEFPGRQVNPVLGIRTRYIEHSSGGYWDYCDFPLAEADMQQVEDWPLATADDFDYGQLRGWASGHEGYAIYLGDPGLGDIINSTAMLRGMEQVLVDLATDDPTGLRLIDRKLDLQMEVLRRSLEAAGERVDFVWMGEDLGTQVAPLISLELYRKYLRPRHQRIIDLARSFGKPVMVHTCGASSWVYEDFIEMGVKAVDTLQPEAAGMAPATLKQRFGGRLMMHGCISTAGPVANGTPADVQRDVRQTIDIMAPGGGYCFAPTHQLQDNSPLENVLAMYEAGRKYGSASNWV